MRLRADGSIQTDLRDDVRRVESALAENLAPRSR
jgi:hypothetical protein